MDRKSNVSGPRLDAANLLGLTNLMNPQHVDRALDLKKAENFIMGGAAARVAARTSAAPAAGKIPDVADPQLAFDKEIGAIAHELDLGGDGSLGALLPFGMEEIGETK